MQLEMKVQCEKCGNTLPADSVAYICSYEFTLCDECTENARKICPHCGGELIPRPRRDMPAELPTPSAVKIPTIKSPMLWAVSFGVWAFVALAATLSISEFDRAIGRSFYFRNMLGLEFSQVLTYAPLTPFVFALAIHFPIRRSNWRSRALLYLGAGVLFSLAHITLRGVTPFAMWEPEKQKWVSGIWDAQLHAFKIRWDVFETLFYLNIVDDLTGTFTPILIVAHAVSYYKSFRERDLRTLQLEGQLAK